MKPLLLHLIYTSLILGCAFFLFRERSNETQLIAFLNRPTDEAYMIVQQNNRSVSTSIKRNIDAYLNSQSMLARQRMHQADSLIRIALAGDLTLDDLQTRFDTLVSGNKATVKTLAHVLPPRNPPGLSPAARLVLAQNDSLRQQMALNYLQNYFAAMTSIDIRFDVFEPVFSYTTICPANGQPLRMDALLSTHEHWKYVTQISVNGEPLELEDDIAHYRCTFPAPGDYSLKVEALAPVHTSSGDSLIATEKNFFLHVTN